MQITIAKAREFTNTLSAAVLLQTIHSCLGNRGKSLVHEGDIWVVLTKDLCLEESGLHYYEYRNAMRRLKYLDIIQSETYRIEGRNRKYVRFTDRFVEQMNSRDINILNLKTFGRT